MKKYNLTKVVEVSKIIDNRNTRWSIWSFNSKDKYFTVTYSYYNIPKRITPWCPQSKKKSDKVYGVETIKHKTEDKVYVFGSPVTVTFNGKLYNLANELEFDMLHHDLDVECTLNNLG